MTIFPNLGQDSSCPAPLSRIKPSRLAPLRWFLVTAAFVGIVVSTSAFASVFPSGLASGSSVRSTADDDTNAAETGPATGAVRLSSVDGQVSVVQDGQVIADPATANLPLFEGSQITTGEDGRAEVQLEDGSLARLSPNSTLTFSVLRKQGNGMRTEVVLNQGLAYFEMQPGNSEHGLRVNYGSASFTATSFSVVRIRMDAAPGDLAVFSGNVHLDSGDSLQLDIHGGESLGLDTADPGKYSLTETIDQDSWDSWNADRDQALNQLSAEKTRASSGVNMSDNVGMNDLDANGSWYNVPGQGYIWSPYDAQAMGASWDPYGYGRWVFYPRYGYVWVSGYGWGYAPYQCGLWNYYDTIGWGWLPGGATCNPWWQNGGWGYGLGNYPRGYQPPRRPMHPVGPRPGGPHPVGGHTLVAGSVVPVDRRRVGDIGVVSRPSQPVVINGHTVEPLSPIVSRPIYQRPIGIAGAGGGGGSLRAGNSAYIPSSGSHSTIYSGVYSGSHPVYSSNSGSRPSAPSAGSHPSAGGSVGGGSHAVSSGGSGGGGGGGGGHASSGGGGGGASHK